MSSSNPSLYTTSNSSTSTLRPRNPRLISFIEDENSLAQDTSTTATTSATNALPFPPLGSSSIASNDTRTTPHGRTKTDAAASKRLGSQTASVWDPWASISGIASTFLGNDGSRSTPVSRSNSAKRASVAKKERGVYSTKTAKAWGPKDASAPVSSVEDRNSILQAKKREAILIANSTEQKDSLGRFKRKDSDTGSPPDLTSLEDDDVLVYRHNIHPHDTMAGVVIKYSCQPEVFRKVNRFWPNDNIQRRRHVLLPVDACSIRGRKVDEPNPFDLLAPASGKPKDNGKAQLISETASSEVLEGGELAASPAPVSPQKWPQEENYKHDHWVLLPSFTQPTEILRLSKRNLGYFPPARRKSNATPFTDSTTSTPKSSFDMLRHPPTHAAQQAQLSQRQQLPPYLNASTRPRSSSTMSAPLTASTAFVSVLHGPGGVGTLRGLRTEKARPGPAEDALNKKFAQYIPDLLPPQGDDRFLSPNRHHRTASSSLRVTPRASTESVRSARSNSSGVPTAIDGWLKRMTSSGTPGTAAKMAIGGRLPASQLGGDLIELDDTVNSIRNKGPDDLTTNTTQGEGGVDSSSKSDQDLMNERFPIRGRVTRAYEAD